MKKSIIIILFLCFSTTCQAKELDGFLGIQLGESIKPYAEGHYANKIKRIKGLNSNNNNLRYWIIHPKNPLTFDLIQNKYTALINHRGQIIELQATGKTKNRQCQYTKDYQDLKNFSNSINNMDVKCSGRMVTITMKENKLFNEYINKLKSEK